MKINMDKLRSPAFIFVAYVAAGSLLILGYRYIFPGEASPLAIYSQNWRAIRGIISIITLFPALALSALVVPFGILSDFEDTHGRFSPYFFQRMSAPVITAISASLICSLLFFLALPLARNHEENMRFQGEMYRMAKEKAQEHGRAGEWIEASQYIGICDSVWADSPELATLRADVEIYLESLRYSADLDQVRKERGASISALPGQREPFDATEALDMAETALNEGRLLDAHWLATLAERIARAGSPETAAASRIAASAWNQIELQRPSALEERAYSLYRHKMSAYHAMVSGDWIRAFYLFQELYRLSPRDPDAEKFLAACEKGTKEIAFFIEEMAVSHGETNVGVLFSLPARGEGQTRAVMRVASINSSPDYAYGIGIEYMSFDSGAGQVYSLQAPYAKFLPITLNGSSQVLVLMRALDREDSAQRWEPEWTMRGEAYQGPAQITLNVPYETFLMLIQMRQEIPGMQFRELFAAREIAAETGYIPEVFEAEIFDRLGGCLFFLPMAIITLGIGWRLRVRQRPRYIFAPLLFVLPVVFNGLAYLYKAGLGIIGTSLILALGFSAAMTLYIVILSLSFLLSLIFLAAQHG